MRKLIGLFFLAGLALVLTARLTEGGLAVFTDQAGVTGNTFTFPITSSFTSTADTWVYDGAPTVNNGTDIVIKVRSFVGPPTKKRRSFVQFDVSAIPAGSTVSSATLTLCATLVPGNTRVYDVIRVTASWVETTVTWNTQPAVAAAATDSATTPPTPSCMTWTVAADVQAWVDGAANDGWRISDNDEVAATQESARFRSREEPLVTAERPKLDVTYMPP